MTHDQLPSDTQDYWFKKMVSDKLKELSEGQQTMVSAMDALKLEVNSFRPVKQVVYAGIGAMLLAILTAVLALVIVGHSAGKP